MAYNPFSPLNTGVGVRTSTRRRVPSSDARVVFKAANGRPAAIFRLLGSLGGSKGNRYRVTLNRVNSSPRWVIRLWDPAGTQLGQVAAVSSLASMQATLAADATLGPLIDMRVIQSVNEVFSSTANFAEASVFTGGA
tara:strand:- start:111 stop:521 length:411 start_codon:yes stop_codon:yes gene_type:complete